MKTIDILITGEQGSGKTRFLLEVLLPALQKSTYAFVVKDGDPQPIGERKVGTRIPFTSTYATEPCIKVRVTNERVMQAKRNAKRAAR
jgi:CO dehydrogenase nickel-insertion accessory protein CooC1